MSTFSKTIEENDLDAESLSVLVGVTTDDAAAWITAGEVPDEHVEAVEQALEVDLSDDTSSSNGSTKSDDSDDSDDKNKKKSKKKKSRSRSRSSVKSDVAHALRVAVEVAFATPEDKTILEAVASVTLVGNESDADRVILTCEGLLSLSKTTTDALTELVEMRTVENEIMIAMQLAQKDKRQLNELNRLACLFQAKDETDLPSNNDQAAMVVFNEIKVVTAEHQATLDKVMALLDN